MAWSDKPLKKLGMDAVPQRFNPETNEWEVETTEADKVTDETAHQKLDASITELQNLKTELQAQKAQLQGIINGTTPANTRSQLTGSTTEEVTFLNTVINNAYSPPITVDSLKSIKIQVSGTSTDRTVEFQGSVNGENYSEVAGFRLSDYEMSTQITQNNELWEVDLTNLKYFRVALHLVVGGDVTVVGKAGL